MRYALLLVLASPLAAQTPDSVQATLLHKNTEGDGGFIHAVPLGPGHAIVHTVPSTGVMKPLLKAKPRSWEAMNAVLRTTDLSRAERIRLFQQLHQHQGDFVAGIAVDKQRMYVLTATRLYPGRLVAAAQDAAKLKPSGHNFRLYAFWLADGTSIMGNGYQLPLVNDDPDAQGPPDTTKASETLGRGPLELVDGGVQCRGTIVTFDDKSVKMLDIKGKQFTPPRDFFNPRLRSR